ncbi:non-ribosomal peptide synthetase [Niabella soli]|uniref:Carrier domain-containing protein n=1 Tax=Niabella soli DSM 19437 TaxID=929713 RepID=W0F6H1_9BACT|nr:non-ribosomal peptide synthetase [Niabella soli]AHF17054.1 hypothetical protein NIASO_00970 [Niabella soli DSM 19437]
MVVDKVSSEPGYNPFAGNSIEKALPATEPQTEILVSCVIGGDEANLAYNQSMSLSFTGPLNEPVLRESLQELLNRNEALRSSFNADVTRMFIYSHQSLDLFYRDISSDSKLQQDVTIDAYNRKDAVTTFDLINGPLIRFALFKKAEDQFLLTITVHHVICDGWTWGIMFEQLSSVYNSKLKNEPLSDQPLLFSDYVQKVLAFSGTDEYAQIEKYWLDEYKNNIPFFEVQPDFPRPSLRTYKSNGYNYTLSDDLAEAVKKTGAKYGCSFVNTLMSVFEILLYKYTGNNDIVIGLPTTGQTATEMHYLVGHCVNFLALRSHPDDALSFVEYLKLRKSKTLMDYEHQQFTYGALLKKLNIKRDAARIPLTPVSFNVSFGINMHVAFDAVDFEIIYNPRVSETFELTLNVTEGRNGYVFRWAYNAQLYEEATIRGLMQKYLQLLQQIVEDPERKIGDLYIDNQPAQKPDKCDNTYQELPDKTVAGLFEEMVRQYPDNSALGFGGETLTYRQLNELANREANFLLARGLKKGDIVGLVLERAPQVIISMLAVLKCGGAYLPIDPGFPEDRINFMLEDSEARFVLVNNTFSGKLNPAASLIVIENIKQELLQAATAVTNIPVSGGDLAYLLYTSGSTGKPKGVMVSHKNLLNFLLSMKDIFRTGIHTKLLSVTTISFDIAGLEIYLPLISGGQLVLADKNTAKDSKALIELLKTGRIGMMQATPATYKLMLQEEWPGNRSLTLLCGGEALSKKVAEALLQKCDRLFNMYGPTETTIWSTVKEISASDKLITIGRPIQNTSVYVLDEDHNVLPPGTEGEIFIGGDGVALGYYKRPGLTAERFIPDLFSDKKGAKLYKTGDLGKYLPNGELVCLGRSDNQAKIRGFRIELEEIEHYISKIEGIKDAVVKVEDADGLDPRLIGYVVLSDTAALNGAAVTRDEIIKWRRELGRTLPDYMIPNGWVKLKEFPLTPNKKVDRKALKYKTAEDEIQKEPLAPSEELAVLIVGITNIWEEGIGVKGIEPNDNFFELGGNSMIAIKVMAEIEKQTGAKLPIATLFESPTIKSLAEIIDTNKNFNHSRVVIPIKPTGEKHPIFLVHAGGLNIMLYKSLSQYFDENQPLYGLQGLGIDGDVSHLKSMESIAQRYLSEVLEHDPTGPYIIMGYSFGGVIAFEMAKQLLAMGKKVKMLGILDTNIFREIKYSNKAQLYAVKALRQFPKIAFYIKQLIITPRDFFKYQGIYLKKKFNKEYVDPEFVKLEIYDYDEKVVQAYYRANQNYEFKPIDIKIDLFRTEEKLPYFNVDSKYFSWRKYALKGVKRHVVPGTHATCMLPPNNEMLAKKIQAVVDNK